MATGFVKEDYCWKVCNVTGFHRVEVVNQPTRQHVGVTDDKDTDPRPLVFNVEQWQRFIRATRLGWYDL
ncbi:hypothetical protein [Candidatus Sororendozoicomonas aggregata]|uniref:hypothetical protein n=1 Tax=Candidatus Sororendozoicomonas aggregata TaxID=3073239 RepID=UPI002ED1F2E9